ncbi:hypothetical protein SGGMMB4_00208 [Sodalis glossinidius str. 'morsitans']|uniref:Hypothetical phage protein n=1 Tax=Sodalis glossinidius (strain morsitans) TaxID=343509 RepID=Q2NWV1_SODGM|nr:hypothetical protein [Sodalis glossinidius]BAE73374.1 hypothetical phage protein [Sodalis glossinidius str. 'morsitans']CRL43704.1 hypothetical protein SGGMMB4_00208 [Sodalis glossinidius str. 'morsitans']
MGQVAFDTLQASEELETAGISREQARAISLVVRKSHEVADVATKADIVEVKRDIADVCKDMEARFEKNEAQMQARFEKTDAQIADVRKDLSAEIALLRKDVEHTANGLLIKLSAVMLAIAGLASTIVTVAIKLL